MCPWCLECSGAWRSPWWSTASSRPTPRMCSQVGMGSKPSCSPFWMGIMPSKVGRRLEERGMVALLQPGLTRAVLNEDRLGHLLDALFAAQLNRVFGAIARKALEVCAIPTPWVHQDTTTMALYGADEDEPQTLGAP